MSLGSEITTLGSGGHATVAVDPLCDFDRSESYGPFAPMHERLSSVRRIANSDTLAGRIVSWERGLRNVTFRN